ncbi:hypothetical protein PG984_003574 [Apiospora sp. TS-2023a]
MKKTKNSALSTHVQKEWLMLQNPNDKLISLLEKESPILEHQRKSFSSISKGLDLTCMFEELPTAIGIVVPQWSAVIDGFNIRQQPIPANHMDMCRFATRDEIGYKRLAHRIKKVTSLEFGVRSQTHRVMKQALLNSLAFESMKIRERDLEPAHRHTFRWIMNEDRKKTSPFLKWLWAEESILWLSGKPGSGKSTLMKFIATYPNLAKMLQPYFRGQKLLLISHYLYERGHESLQKSREGLLRHLLHEILSQYPRLSWIIFRLYGATRSFDHHKDWSWWDLEAAFKAVLVNKPRHVSILCLIDGLDEYRPMAEMKFASRSGDLDDEEEISATILDGHQAMADLALEISKYDRVKLLVSSRPFTIFRTAFAPFREIELHWLTEDDIAYYVTDRLQGNDSLARLDDDHPSFVNDVSCEIRTKAEGVFLWVRLVLDVFFRRLRQYDTADELLQRIREMPPKLGGRNGLYMNMLLNLAPRDRLEAFKYFQVLLRSRMDPDPLILFFATADPKSLFMDPMRKVDIQKLRSFGEDRAMARTGGLLQIYKTWHPAGNKDTPEKAISFIHLTAKEFVSDPKTWRHILPNTNLPQFDGLHALLRAWIMTLKCATPNYDRSTSHPRNLEIWSILELILQEASKLENEASTTRPELILLLDILMFKLCLPQCARNGIWEPWTDTQNDTNLSYEDLITRIMPRLLHASASAASVRPHWAVREPGKPWLPRDKGLIAVAVQSSLVLFLRFLEKQNSAIVAPLFQGSYPLLAYAAVPYLVETSTPYHPTYGGGPPHSTAATIRQLLASGQDPNRRYTGPVYWRNCTIWEGFLAYGGDCLYWTSAMWTDEMKALSWTRWMDNAALFVRYGANLHARCQLRSLTGAWAHFPRHSAIFVVALVIWRLQISTPNSVELLDAMIAKGAMLCFGELQAFRTSTNPARTNDLASDILEVLAKADPVNKSEPAVAPLQPGYARNRDSKEFIKLKVHDNG